MELRVPRLTHTFLRMVVVLVCSLLLLNPVAPVFAVHTDNSGDHLSPIGTPIVPGTPPGMTPAPTEPVDFSLPDGTPVSQAVLQASGEAQLEDFVFSTTIKIGGFVAWLGGTTLEYAFSRFVMKLGCYFTSNSAGDCTIAGSGTVGDGGRVGGVVNELWIIIRDLFNVIFIFSLIYIGFRIILGSDDSGAKKSLINLIYAALIVNFSLYIAKFVLDVANFSAVQIYKAFSISGQYSIKSDTEGVQDLIFSAEYGIASAFMETLQVASFFQADGVGDQSLLFGIMAMFFLIILGFVFFYGAFMIFTRFIAIIFLLILSPAMFLGLVLPSFKSYSDKWRKMFVAYTFFAPVYVFMLYLSLYVLKQLTDGLAKGGLNDAFKEGGNPDSVAIYVFLFIGMGFLLASTKVAGAMSQGGAVIGMNAASNWAKKISLGAAAVGGGYAATAGLGLAGKGMTAVSDAREARTGKSSVLTRNLRSLGETTKNKKIAGVNTAASIKGYNDAIEKSDKEARGKRDGRNNELKQDAAIEILSDTTRSADHEKAIANLSPSAVVAMAKDKKGAAVLKQHAALLRPDQIKALQDDKDLDKAVIKEIASTRTAGITSKYAATDIGKANTDDLQLFEIDTLKKPEYAIGLSGAKIDKLPATKFTEAEKQGLKDERNKAITTLATGGTVPGWTIDKLMSSNDFEAIARFPEAAVRAPAVIEKINKASLTFMRQKQTQTDTTMSWIRTRIKTSTDPRLVPMQKWLTTSPAGIEFGA